MDTPFPGKIENIRESVEEDHACHFTQPQIHLELSMFLQQLIMSWVIKPYKLVPEIQIAMVSEPLSV